jgi:hypothetical protein
MKSLVLSGAAAALLLSLAALGCRPTPSPPPTEEKATAEPWFEEITERVGLDFRHDAGPLDGNYFLPQITGSGAALFDCDGDGRLDVLLLQNGGPHGPGNRLYRQKENGRFEDVSAGSGLDFAGYNMGVAIGDVDNDGRPDVLVTQYGGLRLLLNQGGGRFRDVSREAGISSLAWGTSAAFFDYDRDGRLDLIVVSYVDYTPAKCSTEKGEVDYCSPSVFHGSASRLFHNEGAGPDGVVRFTDRTWKSGIGTVPGPGLGVACADFDGDGWPDVFVANDGQPNRLWINQKDGTFKEEALARGVAYNGAGQAQAGMGVAIGDVDGDGLLDLFVTHLTGEINTLWRQGPVGRFRDRTAAAGLAAPAWRGTGFGVVPADFDLDGALDLAVVNGRVERGWPPPGADRLGAHWARYAERNQLFVNDGSGRFRDASAGEPALCGQPAVGRGLVCGDIDGDGAPDLLMTAAGSRARLFRNVAPRRGNWLSVRVVEPDLGGRDAPGAEVTAVLPDGRRLVRPVGGGDSYLCAGALLAHFGLGAAAEAEAFEVRWPDGSRERFAGGAAGQRTVLRKGAGSR